MVLLAALLVAHPAAARDRLPCVQLLAPAMTPAQVWASPPLEAQDTAVTDPAVADLVDRAADLGADPGKLADQARALAETAPGKATQAAAAGFARLQAMRAATLEAISDTAANLRRRLDSMDARLDRINALPAEDPQRADLTNQQDRDRQVIEAGRRLLTGLCERPSRIEARFGTLARALSPRP